MSNYKTKHKTKRTNNLYSSWLTIHLSFICFYYPLKAIILSYFKKITRDVADKIIKNFTLKLVAPLKINTEYHNWDIVNNLPTDRPIIFMSNHSSLYDIPIIINSMPDNIHLRMLAKKELTKVPVFGQAMLKLGFPIVDRKNHTQALKDLEHTKQLMQTGIAIWAAPEGTRSLTGELLPFKKGIFIMAIEMGAIIVPMTIKGASKVLPAKSYKYSLGETVELWAYTPIDTQEYSLADKDQLISTVREKISSNI